MFLSRTFFRLTVMACLALFLAPSVHAAESTTPDGWICTTEPLVGAALTGAEQSRARALQPTARFANDGALTVRFASPAPAGATWERTGGTLPARTAAPADCTVAGFTDQATRHGVRYRYALAAPNRADEVITVGSRIPAPTDRGTVVLVIEESMHAAISFVLSSQYIPALERAGWTVRTELVRDTATPQAVRARLQAHIAADPRTASAFLIGRVPVAYTGHADAGARPSDAYYADTDGVWTDSLDDGSTAENPARRNVPGDGKFDQDTPPSDLELAVGRLDLSRLPTVVRDQQVVNETTGVTGYLIRAAGAQANAAERVRNESFVIDAAGNFPVPGSAPWQAAGAIGERVFGTRADLALRGVGSQPAAETRPAILVERGAVSSSAAIGTGIGTADDIAGPTSVGTARFVLSAGEALKMWDEPDSLLRSRIVGISGAEATAQADVSLDGLALGDPIGRSVRDGANAGGPGLDPLSTLFGDPTLTLQPGGAISLPGASVQPGCTDTRISWTVRGTGSQGTTTADVYRIVDGADPELLAAGVALRRSGTNLTGNIVDAGVVTRHPGAAVRYEIRPVTRVVTNRGSFDVQTAPARTASLTLRCPWTCGAPTGPRPTDPVEASRSAQLESTVSFSDQGRTARIQLDRAHTGRTLRGRRIGGDPRTYQALCAGTEAATAFVEPNLSPGTIHEFEFTNATDDVTVPVLVGHDLPPVLDRGRLLVVRDTSLQSQPGYSSMLLTWLGPLVADGYEPVMIGVDRADSVASVRAKLKAAYDVDPERTRTAVLIGHVPVPYSGTGKHDGHGDHAGAWATDAPYADLDGNWTDTSVSIADSPRPQNHNVPGDGKFDQNRTPSTAELAVGRIDFADMPILGSSEASLIIEYLRRDLLYRRGDLPFSNAAFTRDNFGFTPAGHLMNVSPVVGAANVSPGLDAATAGTLARADGRPYFMAYTAGGGSYSSSTGIGTANDPVPALFMASYGSYYGDWDSTNNFLRGHLFRHLGAMWEHWSVDGLALGETIGQTVQRNMNRPLPELKTGLNSFLGDPTLRAFPFQPVGQFSATTDQSVRCGAIRLTWTPSPASSVRGYILERVVGSAVPRRWQQVGSELPSTATTVVDPFVRTPGLAVSHRLRPVRTEVTPRGSFSNTGQGRTTSTAAC